MFKKFESQPGSAHIVVVVIIVLAIISAVGFVFWKNFIQNTSVRTPNLSASSQVVKSDYITIDSWGVKFKIADALKSTDVETSTSQSSDTPPQTSYNFTTKRIQNLGGACSAGTFSHTQILTRFADKPITTPDGELLNETAIGGYYYVLGAPAASCSVIDTNGTLVKGAKVSDIEVNDREALKSSIETISSINPDPNEGYLVLNDWKIRFKLPADIGEVTFYELPVNDNGLKSGLDTNYYEFSTKAVEALGEQCVAPGTNGGIIDRLASLSRGKTKLTEVDDTVFINDNQPIGGYYYYLSPAQSTCSDRGTDIQIKDHKAIEDLLQTPQVY